MTNDIKINDIKDMEKYFSNNLKSPLFPILADLYYEKGDYIRSQKVCQIGIKYNPESTVGYYILAKISLIKEELKKAEELLLKSISLDDLNINSMNLLLSVQIELNRNKTIIKKNVDKIVELDQKNIECKKWLEDNYKKKIKSKTQKKIVNEKNKEINKKTKNSITEIREKVEKKAIKKENIKVNDALASMTLFNIYKSQGYYEEALKVLNILKAKDTKNKKIQQEIDILIELIGKMQ
ncbi:MAG: hypothetical protein CMG07_03770 [Candidatus Marinimicrobia bacterium]|nr:hypothetical protein [Candidatus Neomarinimicrobiota bacterium]|tara:strand:+ start:2565 stop:3278 length:714 start_codon:yes stop_codon:yes gene_type:complete